jgi:hypothetical protein
MIFTDCPVGVAFDDSLQCSMIDCVVWFQENSGTAVSIGTTTSGQFAKETYIAGCTFEAGGTSTIGTGIGISVVHADELRVMNTRVEAFGQGIVIAPYVGFAQHLFFENVSVFTTNASTTVGAALLIQPTNEGNAIQAVFVGCQFGPSETSSTSYTGAGVLIDQSQTSAVVDQIRLISCWSCDWPGDGLQINAVVTNVEILGGFYSCNGQSSSGTYSGILIASAGSSSPQSVRIVGAACNNSVYTDINGGTQMPKTQGYGISVGTGATHICVRGCDLTENVTAALSATTPDVTVQVTDCDGYNNKATRLATEAPPNDTIIYATQTYGYCGAIAFYLSGGNSVLVKINGNATGLASGEFTLGAGETAELQYTAAPTFYAVGR